MKKFFLMLLIVCSITFIGCKETETDKSFLEVVTEMKSYKAEGIIESFYNEGRKQNNFVVYYKYPDLIKVEIKGVDNKEKQIILKNQQGVYILIPTVNKNFKINSSWPDSAGYPYLLQSLAKDIANDENKIVTTDELTTTIETDTKMYKDATPVKQKIIINNETALPEEVLVYTENGDLYMRIVFTKIEIDKDISDDEFIVEKTLSTARLEYEDQTVVFEREISYPTYFPVGATLVAEDTISSADGNDVRSIMKFIGENVGFTLIQEYVNDKTVTTLTQETGEVFMILGNVGILKSNGMQMINEGVEYTIATNDLKFDEMYKVMANYITDEGK